MENEEAAKQVLFSQRPRESGAADLHDSDEHWFDNKANAAEELADRNTLIDKIKTFNSSNRLQPERHAYKSQLSKHQEEIMSSIETLNYSLFVDLGGTTNTNLNFYSQVGDSIVYPIMSAAAKGSKEMIELCLMNKTIDIQVINNLGVNAFWVACMYGHGGAMRILAEAGIYLFCTNQNKVNALHLAVNRNHVHIVEMLLDSNYPLDLETADGMTAFQLAAYHGHSKIIEIMIAYL